MLALLMALHTAKYCESKLQASKKACDPIREASKKRVALYDRILKRMGER